MTGKTHDNPAKAGGLKQGDKAIRKALSGKTLEAKLPTNFTYTTMNRVQELSRRMERRSDRRTFIVSIIIAVAFLALGVLTIPDSMEHRLKKVSFRSIQQRYRRYAVDVG